MMKHRNHRILGMAAGLYLFLTHPAALAAPAPGFWDVPADHWAAEYIAALTERGILTGYEDGSFQPDAPVTRAELAKLMYAVDGAEPLDYEARDSNWTYWAAPYVTKLRRDGYTAANLYRTPNYENAVSRGELAVSMALMNGYQTEEPEALFAAPAPAIDYALKKGLVTGYEDGSFRPDDPVTRAEAAALLWRTYQMNVKEQYQGDLREGLPHGQGVFRYASGDWYEGGFENGMFSGSGVYHYGDQGRYDGSWENGRASGQGQFAWEGFNYAGDTVRETYTGGWKDSLMHGAGVWRLDEGSEGVLEYEGEFRDGVPYTGTADVTVNHAEEQYKMKMSVADALSAGDVHIEYEQKRRIVFDCNTQPGTLLNGPFVWEAEDMEKTIRLEGTLKDEKPVSGHYTITYRDGRVEEGEVVPDEPLPFVFEIYPI